MKRALLATALLLPAGCQHQPAATPVPAVSAVTTRWTADAPDAEHPFFGYTVRNDVHGAGPGPQRIWADSPARWGVRADHPETGAVQAHPHVGRTVGRSLGKLRAATSRFAVSVPAGGRYSSAYTLRCGSGAYEVVLWVNWQGNMPPLARDGASASQPGVETSAVAVGGHTWDVYKGRNGAAVVISFRCTNQLVVGEVDVKAILDWVRNRGWFGAADDLRLDEVQFGWEIAASPGGLEFTVKDFALDVR